MMKNRKISIVIVAVFLIGLFSVGLVTATNPTLSGTLASTNTLPIELPTTMEEPPILKGDPETVSAQPMRIPIDLEKLKEMVPQTIDDAEANIVTVRGRFLLYTRDGVHIMWGRLGNGIFVGEDNLGVHCWGIYGQGVFAGFYGGEFFHGRYHNGYWKAQYLFGLDYSGGQYVLFPVNVPTPAVIESLP